MEMISVHMRHDVVHSILDMALVEDAGFVNNRRAVKFPPFKDCYRVVHLHALCSSKPAFGVREIASR